MSYFRAGEAGQGFDKLSPNGEGAALASHPFALSLSKGCPSSFAATEVYA